MGERGHPRRLRRRHRLSRRPRAAHGARPSWGSRSTSDRAARARTRPRRQGREAGVSLITRFGAGAFVLGRGLDRVRQATADMGGGGSVRLIDGVFQRPSSSDCRRKDADEGVPRPMRADDLHRHGGRGDGAVSEAAATPAPPAVTTHSAVRRRWTAARSASSSVSTAMPESISASTALTIRTSTSPTSSEPSGRAGAAFRQTTRPPRARRRAAAMLISSSISFCSRERARRARDPRRPVRHPGSAGWHRRRSPRRSRPQHRRSRRSCRSRAVENATWLRSTPAASRPPSRKAPKSSSPTAPTILVAAPARAAATAWLPPLPPNFGRQPIAGHRLALARPLRRVDHDVVVQAAHDDDGAGLFWRSRHQRFRFPCTAPMVLARLRSAAARSRWATATKTASRMFSCTIRAAAFSPRSGEPWAVEQSTTSAIRRSASRRSW